MVTFSMRILKVAIIARNYQSFFFFYNVSYLHVLMNHQRPNNNCHILPIAYRAIITQHLHVHWFCKLTIRVISMQILNTSSKIIRSFYHRLAIQIIFFKQNKTSMYRLYILQTPTPRKKEENKKNSRPFFGTWSQFGLLSNRSCEVQRHF